MNGNPSCDVMVIGSGLAGLESARCLGLQDFKVIVIDKEKDLKSMFRRLNLLYPEGMPNSHTIDPLIDAVLELDNVEIRAGVTIEKVSGKLGDYKITIKKDNQTEQINTKAIIVATGLISYDIEKVTAYGYGRYENVLTPIEFEEQISRGEIDSDSLKNVVIIHCAGSRDENFLPYCSRVCCFIGLKQAKLIKDMNPDCNVYSCYMDIRVYGKFESLYKTLRDVHNVTFIKGRPSKVEQIDGKLFVITEDITLGEKIKIPADYVIVNHGYTGDEETLKKLRIPLDSSEKGAFPTTYIHASLSVDSNPRGIYICGGAAYPKNVAETIADARSAAMGVMNSLKNTEMKTPVAEINSDICAELQCKLCLSVCPYGAIYEEDEEIKVDESMCMGCGICTATCAAGANSLPGWSDKDMFELIDKQVKENDVVAFLCKWCAYPAAKPLVEEGLEGVNFFEIPCTGRISGSLLLHTFDKNPKGVLVAGCYPDSCHYVKGNFHARRRIFLTRKLLEQFGIPPDKLRLEWGCNYETKRMKKILTDMKGGR
ncbi:hypothetical protein DRQ33_01200 [bacterium]|nr:MAG: hypothetical protein DRQ33_01200 [bacterium]